MSTPLPPDAPNQVYLSVKAMCAGRFWLPDTFVFQDSQDRGAPDSEGVWVPDFAFLVTHPTKGRALFDLGIRKVSCWQLFVARG